MGIATHVGYGKQDRTPSWAFEIDSNQKLYVWQDDSTGQFSVNDDTLVVPKNKWCFVGFTMNGTDITFYLGDETGMKTSSKTSARAVTFNTSYGIEIGRIGDGFSTQTNELDSYVDSFRYYDKVLSASEMTDIFNKESSGTPTYDAIPLQGYLLNKTTNNHVRLDDITTDSIDVPIIESGDYTFIANNAERDSEMRSNDVIATLVTPSGDTSNVTGTSVEFDGFDEMTVTTTGTNLNLGYRTAIRRDTAQRFAAMHPIPCIRTRN